MTVAASSPQISAASASADTFSAPFTTTVVNTCVVPSDEVVINGVEHVTFDTATGHAFTFSVGVRPPEMTFAGCR